jgi:hypothetical protein
LTVVVAQESDRQRLAEHLQATLTGSDCDRLQSWRATCVEVRDLRELHVDEEVRDGKDDDVLMTIKPASLRVLA